MDATPDPTGDSLHRQGGDLDDDEQPHREHAPGAGARLVVRGERHRQVDDREFDVAVGGEGSDIVVQLVLTAGGDFVLEDNEPTGLTASFTVPL